MAQKKSSKNEGSQKKLYSFKIARCQNPIKRPLDILKQNDGWWPKDYRTN